MFKKIGNKPIRMWIDGKCYNIRERNPNSKKRKLSNPADSFEEDLELTDDQIEIINENGKLQTSFQLPSVYYKKLSILPNFDLTSLSKVTKTQINVPKFGKTGNITIIGEHEQNIKEALRELHTVIGQIRQQNKPLQFTGIPLLSEEIKENFEKFRTEILAIEGINGMNESIFQKAQKLHLTVNVFSLLDEREVNEAVNALQDYETNLNSVIEKYGPLKIRVSGIDCMNDNYKKVHVLYANAEIVHENPEVSLQKIVNDISDHFYERGLLKSHIESVKLHMTLINTKYNTSLGDRNKKMWQKRIPFDATQIMEKHKDFVFGESSCSSIHLLLMSSKGDDGFYKTVSVLKV